MSKKTVKISIAGSAGRMGKMLVNVVEQHVECELVAATCHPSEKGIIGKDDTIPWHYHLVSQFVHSFQQTVYHL